MKTINVGLHNRFDIIVRDANTGEIKKEAYAENVILNRFWEYFFSKTTSKMDLLKSIQFGSGTAEPLATDTKLTTYIGGKDCTTDSVDASTYYADGVVKRKRSIRIEAGERTGAVISEVGFSSATWGPTYQNTKALIKDSNGNPLSITVGASDVIDIFATFFAKVPMDLVNGTNGIYVAPNSAIVNYLLCLGTDIAGTGYCVGLGSPAGLPASNEIYACGATASSNEPAKTLTLAVSNVISANGNFGGFRSYCGSGWCIKLPRTGFAQPVLTKEVIATGDGMTKDFTCAFGNILNNGTAKLYVNDVEVPATFEYDTPKPRYDSPRYYCGSHMRFVSNDATSVVFENPYYNRYGVVDIRASIAYAEYYKSDNGVNWTLVYNGILSHYEVAPEHQKARYWKVAHASGVKVLSVETDTTWGNAKFIHADSAPAAGTTVALTYQPDCIAKDANHIINNVSITFSFNEYAPE